MLVFFSKKKFNSFSILNVSHLIQEIWALQRQIDINVSDKSFYR